MYQPVQYSVVIPLKDEEESVQEVVEELHVVMSSLKQNWELICIDDGSTDGTWRQIEELKKRYSELVPLAFDNNYGQSSALDAGFKMAKGEFVITMDGDGQNNPTDIPKLLRYIEECDLVCGLRTGRKDSWGKCLISRIANTIRSRVCKDGMEDTGCSLKIYRKSCLDSIRLYEGMHRFLPALFQIEGFTVKQVPVEHRHRKKGKSKYGFSNRSWNTVMDMLAVRWMRKRHLSYTIRHK